MEKPPPPTFYEEFPRSEQISVQDIIVKVTECLFYLPMLIYGKESSYFVPSNIAM